MQNTKQENLAEARWYKSGYLPHFDSGEIAQFVTYRLAGSLPAKTLKTYKHLFETKQISEIEYHDMIDRYLDKGFGPDHLRRSEIAELVKENLLRFHRQRYFLHAWVIMINHVHIIFTPLNGFTLASILHSMKSYTANHANRVLDRAGAFWAREYYDRYIRDQKHFLNTMNYIHDNPVKSGLCRRPEDWRFSSASQIIEV